MLFVRASFIVAASAAFMACASNGHLMTSSGKPEVRISRTYLRQLPVAIASYNMNNGRHLDEAKRDAIVTYDGVKTADGMIEVRSKTIYRIIDTGDSIVVTSTRLMTDDLDDENAEVALDQPSLDEQQQELDQIIARLRQMPNDSQQPQQLNVSSSHTQ
jgi:hypothetical protein